MSVCDYRRLVSSKHLEILAQYMERYPLLALSSTRNREEKVLSWKLWDKIAKTMNKIDSRVVKSGRNWSRYWADIKFKTRRKYTMIQKAKTDGRRSSLALTQWEKRIIHILTDDDGNLLPNAHQMSNNYEALQQKINTIQTKVEDEDTCQDQQILPELINVPENEQIYRQTDKHTYNDDIDPIKLTEDYEKEDCRREKKRVEQLRKEMLEFQLRRQKELFEMEKMERREKHDLEMDILRLRKDILMKELNNML